jgi:hypothetical protein
MQYSEHYALYSYAMLCYVQHALTLFTESFASPVVWRVLDVIFFEGSHMTVLVLLAMLLYANKPPPLPPPYSSPYSSPASSPRMTKQHSSPRASKHQQSSPRPSPPSSPQHRRQAQAQGRPALHTGSTDTPLPLMATTSIEEVYMNSYGNCGIMLSTGTYSSSCCVS